MTNRDFDLLQSPRALLLDLRPPLAFSDAFIPGSINLPGFESPALLKAVGMAAARSIYLVTDSAHAVDRAAKFFDRFDDMQIAGYFPGKAVQDWRAMRGAAGTIEHITADTLAVRLAAWKTVVADIRDAAAFRRAHIPDAVRIPLSDLTGALAGLPFETSLSLVCEIGTLCSFAGSLLWNAGYQQLAIVKGGFAAYVEHGLPLAES
ncbi:MAG TPA: rhodanese-like domain-containing protein [Bryobacteraceae bacterium]|nr:rhodanese-like domain-containing protein [Bryobacteraceae bacterium]